MSTQALNNTIPAGSSPSAYFPLSYTQSEYLWSYAGKFSAIVRNLLNAATKMPEVVACAGKNFLAGVKNTGHSLKIFAVVSVIFGFNDLKSSGKNLSNSIKNRDSLGVVQHTLSSTINFLDLFDTGATAINSGLALASYEPVKFFSDSGLPIGFALTGMGIVSRTIQIAKSVGLYRAVHTEIENRSMDEGASLKDFLAKRIGVKEKDIANIVALNDAEIEEKMKRILRKKMTIDVVNIGANLISLAALNLFRTNYDGAKPFLLGALAFGIRISALRYKDLTEE